MALTNLEEDLIQNFLADKEMIVAQLELLKPISVAIHKPAAHKWVNSSLLLIVEYLCYILTIGGIIFIAIMHLIYPFSVLANIYYNNELKEKIGNANFNFVALAIYTITLLCILFVFAIGRFARTIRIKIGLLDYAGKAIKQVLHQQDIRFHLLYNLEQNHKSDFSGIELIHDDEELEEDINDIANPGFGD